MSTEPQKDMSFLDHLEELRWRIIRSLSVVIVIGVAAFIFRTFIFDQIIMAPQSPEFISNRILCNLAHKYNAENFCINQKPLVLQSNSVTQQFNMSIVMACIVALILAFPYIFYEIWSFVKPALYQHERKVARGAIFYISLLFFIGVFFGYFVICPMTISFFADYRLSDSGYIQFLPTIGSYISIIVSTILGCGVAFELPVLVLFLSKIGLMSSKFLTKYRRHAIIVILIIAAIITPPDIFSQIVVSLPLVLLYEIGIVIAKRTEKKKAQSVAAG